MVKGAQKKTGGDSGPGTPQKKSRSYKTGTGSPGVRHKNTKSSQQVDIYETKVDDIVVVVCSKPKDAPEASFTHWHQTKLFEQWGADTLAEERHWFDTTFCFSCLLFSSHVFIIRSYKQECYEGIRFQMMTNIFKWCLRLG